MQSKHLLLAATVAAAFASAPAAAQGVYAELGAGGSRADVDCAGTTTCDREDRFVRGVLGYTFTPNWAAELSLADLGRVKASALVPGFGEVQTSIKLRSVGLGVAATLPLGESLALTGRFGVASNKTSVSGSALGVSVSDSDRNTTAYAGMALRYALSKSTSVGLNLDRTEAEFDGEKAAVVTYGIAARYAF